MSTISRNALCPCGSGKKYKRCHGQNKPQNRVLQPNKLLSTPIPATLKQDSQRLPFMRLIGKLSRAWSWTKHIKLSWIRATFSIKFPDKIWRWYLNHPFITIGSIASLATIILSIPRVYDVVDATLNPFNVGVISGETSNLSSIVFDIQNKGKISLKNILFTCAVDNLTVERPDGRHFRIILDPKQLGWINSANAQTKISKFSAGDSVPFVCNAQRLSDGFKYGEKNMPILSARLRVMINFELPLIGKWNRCFVSQVFSCGDAPTGSPFCVKGEVLGTEVDVKKASDWGDLSLHFQGNPPWCGTAEPAK